MPEGLVEVEPAAVLRVAAELRQASRQYSAAGWRMSTSLPLMPPRFLARTQVTLDVIAARLQQLALALELAAAVEAWRMSCLVDAGAGDLGSEVRQLMNDLSDQGRQAWDDLARESGPQASLDPLGGQVHIALGVADAISQLFQAAETLSHLDPTYATTNPGGAARARQEMIAMAINLVLLLPDTAFIDPAGHRQATEGAAARLVDWRDLERGDLPRWVGHIGTGLTLDGLARGISPADDPALAGEGALDGGENGLGSVLRAGYDGLSQANHLPTDTGGRDPGGAPSRPRQIQARIASLLEQDRGR